MSVVVCLDVPVVPTIYGTYVVGKRLLLRHVCGIFFLLIQPILWGVEEGGGAQYPQSPNPLMFRMTILKSLLVEHSTYRVKPIMTKSQSRRTMLMRTQTSRNLIARQPTEEGMQCEILTRPSPTQTLPYSLMLLHLQDSPGTIFPRHLHGIR